MKTKPEERFWKYVRKTNYCWIWTGAAGGTMGYGQFGSKTERYAHRFSWELHNGPIPKGIRVCHKCDNPPCVNPKHLFIGTQLDNIRDMYKKGRGINGEKNGQAKLKDSQIERIIKAGQFLTSPELAMAFCVDQETIRLILKRKRWIHINLSGPRTRRKDVHYSRLRPM